MARPRKQPGAAILPYKAIEPVEWDAFFRIVAASGSVANAIRCAFGVERHSAVIYHAIDADPVTLGRRLREAQESFKGLLQAEMVRRGVVGADKPVFYKGELVAYTKEASDTLLLALMRQADKSFLDKRSAGDLRVVHADDDSALNLFSMSFDQAERLPRDMRKNLIAILRWVESDNATVIADAKMIEADAEVEQAESDPYDVREAEALW